MADMAANQRKRRNSSLINGKDNPQQSKSEESAPVKPEDIKTTQPKKEMDAEEGALLLQRNIRQKILYRGKFDKKNLEERLLYEACMPRGAARFFNQVAIFVLMLVALRLSSFEEQERGVYNYLDHSFDFEGLREMVTREHFMEEGMPTIAQQSTNFFLLSNKYFVDSEGVGPIQLLGNIERFSGPKISQPITLKAKAFSMTAWVKVDRNFVSGFLIRKSPATLAQGEELACWGWKLDNFLGPQLVYGAHDFFPLRIPVAGEQRQITVGLTDARKLSTDYVMLTVVVTETNVTFYQNTQVLGTRELALPLTDCFNGGEGSVVGAEGMEIGLLKYHPRALTPSGVAEILSSGAVLGDIAKGSVLSAPEEGSTDVELRTLTGNVDGLAAEVEGLRDFQSLSALLQAAKSLATSPQPSPAASLGEIQVNQSVITEPLVSRDFYELVPSAVGPVRLTKTDSAQDHRYLSNVPSFAGTGVTFTFWYRHFECDGGVESCGLYFFKALNSSRDYCYSFWIENNAIWFDNNQGTPPNNFPTGFLPEKFRIDGSKTWRFLAYSLDETTDEIKFYVDGYLAWKGAYGSPVSEVDCSPGKNMTLGRDTPGYSNGAEVEIYDMRMWVHSQTPLAAADIQQLANAPTPALNTELKCFPAESTKMADSMWRDEYGNGCEWYFDQRRMYPTICSHPQAAASCPLACGSRQMCWHISEDLIPYFVWDRIVRIETRGDSNGTICLGDAENAQDLVVQCKAWVASGDIAGAEAWLESMSTIGGFARQGRRLELRDCSEMEEAIDTHCSFSSLEVKKFTDELTQNGGDFTISFWIRPLGLSSLHPDTSRFYPHLQFFGNLSPPQHNLAIGLWGNPNGETRHFSECARASRTYFENVEMRAADNEQWTFISITHKQASSEADGLWDIGTNFGQNQEGSQLPQCLYHPDYFFRALEVNYPALISPIMLVAKALHRSSVQDSYLNNYNAMRIKAGPSLAGKERAEGSKIVLEKEDFSPRSVLMAPPILFLTRGQKETDCNTRYSKEFITNQHQNVVLSTCADPYQCSEEILENPEETMACPGATVETEDFFDLKPVEFDGHFGYADFLTSVTSNPFLFRGNRTVPTANWVDSSTKLVNIILVFYTPINGITSVMQVQADFRGSQSADVSVALTHLSQLEGSRLVSYFVVQSLVLVSVALMLLDILFNVLDIVKHFKEGETPSVVEIFKNVADLCTALLIIVYISIRIPYISNSADLTQSIGSKLTDLPWDSTEIELDVKKQSFLTEMMSLFKELDKDATQSSLLIYTLMLTLLRVIQCTDVHPRLALLTGCLKKAVDDLWHAAILICLLMGCFAEIATLRFGSEREDFATFSVTMQTQFEMMFGSFPADWTSSSDLILYTVLYIVVVFLLIQNFLLAIVVEAYMKVREDNLDMETEQEFFTDVYGSLMANSIAPIRGWPTPWELWEEIDVWKARRSITYRDLLHTGMFKDAAAVASFCAYYQRYDFLEAKPYEKPDEKYNSKKLIKQLKALLPAELALPAHNSSHGNGSGHNPSATQNAPPRDFDTPTAEEIQYVTSAEGLAQTHEQGSQSAPDFKKVIQGSGDLYPSVVQHPALQNLQHWNEVSASPAPIRMPVPPFPVAAGPNGSHGQGRYGVQTGPPAQQPFRSDTAHQLPSPHHSSPFHGQIS